MVEQDILAADGVEDAVLSQAGRQTRGKRWIFEVGSIDQITQGHQSVEVHGAVDAEQVILGQSQLVEQVLPDAVGTVVCHFQPDLIAVLPLRQFTFQCQQQVVDLFLVNKELGIAGDTELVATGHRHAGE